MRLVVAVREAAAPGVKMAWDHVAAEFICLFGCGACGITTLASLY